MANEVDNSHTSMCRIIPASAITYYPYDPSKAAAIVFTIAYDLSAVLHELQYRTSRPQQFTVPLMLGAIFSTIGWGCRALNIFYVGDQDTTFLVSSMFILGAGPTYAGADYFVGGRLFAYIPSIAPMNPLRLVRTFIFFDFLAEILVWVGTSQTGSAAGSADGSHGTQGQIGINLLRVAMILQAVLFVTLMGVLAVFAARFRRLKVRWLKASSPVSTATKKIIFTLAISSILIIVRSVYHVVDNFIPDTSSFHNSKIPVLIFDGLVMFLNVALFNALHPGNILPTDSRLLITGLGEERISQRASSALNDNRPLYKKILDPLDIRELSRRKGGVKTHGLVLDRKFECVAVYARVCSDPPYHNKLLIIYIQGQDWCSNDAVDMHPCRFFLQSRCTKGSSCPFRHDTSVLPATNELQTVTRTRSDVKSTPCRFFSTGACKNGNSCTFTHGLAQHSTASEPTLKNDTQPVEDSRAQITCKFYLRGECINGSRCPYKHSSEHTSQITHGVEENTHEDGTDDFSRTISGALVKFGEGGSVCKISLPSDFSAVSLSGIPATSTASDICQLLHGLGHEIPKESIRLLKDPEAALPRAHVTADDPGFSDALREQLRTTSDPVLALLSASRAPPRIPAMVTSHRINCKKVLISWTKPVRLVFMNFGNHAIAKRISAKFNTGQYTVLGRVIKADEPSGRSSPRNPVDWTVLLKSVPSNASKTDIKNAVRWASDEPRHVEMGNASNVIDTEAAPAFVESMLTDIGPVDFRMRPDTNGKRFKAVALFQDDADAREAVSRLHDQSQDFLGKDKLSMQLLSSSKFKVPAQLYECVRKEVTSHIPTWEKQLVTLREYPDTGGQKRFVTLKLEGEETKHVAAATTVLEAILNGKPIQGDEDNKCPFWEPSLLTNGPAYRTLKQIEQKFGVTIVRDKAKRQLRYFGPAETYVAVQSSVVTELTREPVSNYAIDLTPEDFTWACRGGFNQISSALGKDVVALDVVSRPRRIVISGSREQYQVAVNMIKSKSVAPFEQSKGDASSDCSICWTPAENPVSLECHHVYCLDCFEGLCKTTVASGPTSCQGDMGNCKRVLGMAELNLHLSSAALEEMLEESFASHVRRRPNEYRFCPSSDGGFIYRSTTSAKTYTCPKCLEVTCTSCNNQHGVMTCADYKDLESGGYEAFERFKKSMKIKDCPKCKTPIEKTYGCNHMTCGGCGAHLCWVCLKVFSTGRLCYDHLIVEHGGILNEAELLRGEG